MRGSWSSVAIAPPMTSRMSSLMRRIRAVAIARATIALGWRPHPERTGRARTPRAPDSRRSVADVAEAQEVALEAASVGAARLDEALELAGARPDIGAPDQRAEQRRALPRVVAVDLGDRGTEALAHLSLERRDHLALRLEAAGVVDVQPDLDEADIPGHATNFRAVAWPAGETTAEGSCTLFVHSSAVATLLESLFHLGGAEELEDIADLDVAVAVEHDAALEALLDLAHVVLEATQRADLACPDHRPLPDQVDLGVVGDLALLDDAAGDVADARGAEGLQHLGLADALLDLLGLEHALERGAQVLGDLVDHRVGADVDALFVGDAARLRQGTHVEADDDRVGRRGEHHVGLVDSAGRRVDDVDRDLGLGHLCDLVLERLQRPRDVAFEHEVELLDLALAGLREHLLEAELSRLAPRERLGLEPVGALAGELAGAAVVLDDLDSLAGVDDALEAEHLDRHPGDGLVDARAGEVVHRPDPPPLRTRDGGVPHPQRAALHEHRHDGPAAGVEVRFYHGPGGRCIRVRFQLLELGDQQDHLQQVVEPLLGLRRDVAVDGLPSPVLGIEVVLRELTPHLVGLGVGAIDLVDGDHHRDLRGARVVDRLDRLRHDTVVGRDDDHGEVGDLGPAGPHRRERLVSRGVEEGHGLAVLVDLIGTDVLRDAAGLAGDDLGLADCVEQGGLAVIDVAHDRDDRGTRLEVLLGVLELRLLLDLLGGVDDLDLAIEAFCDHLDHLVRQRLGQGRHLAELHQLLDHLGTAEVERLGDLAHGGAGLNLRGLGLDLGRPLDRLLEQRAPAPAAAASRGPLRWILRHVLAARGLRVDDDAAAPLAAGLRWCGGAALRPGARAPGGL